MTPLETEPGMTVLAWILLVVGMDPARPDREIELGREIRARVHSDAPVLEKRGPSVSFLWTSPLNGPVTVTVESYDFDAFVRVEELEGKVVGENDDGGVETNAWLIINAGMGQRYRLRVAARQGESGEFVLKVRRGKKDRVSGKKLLEEAIRYRQEAANRARARGDRAALLRHEMVGGKQLSSAARYEPARARLEAAMTLAEELKDRSAQISIHKSLGYVAIGEGNPADARRHFERRLELATKARKREAQVDALRDVVRLLRMTEELERAEKLQRLLVELTQKARDPHGVAAAHLGLGEILIARKRPAEARRELERARATFHELGDFQGEVRALERFAVAALATGDRHAARSRLLDALEIAVELDLWRVEERIRRRLEELERGP